MRNLGGHGHSHARDSSGRTHQPRTSCTSLRSSCRVGEAHAVLQNSWQEKDGERDSAPAVEGSVQAGQNQIGSDDCAKYPELFDLATPNLSPFRVIGWLRAEGSRANRGLGEEDPKLGR